MKPVRGFAAAAVSVSAFLAVLSIWVASSFPDGLGRVAEKLGFAGNASAPVLKAPIPDYAVPGAGRGPLAGIAGAAVGVALAFAVAWGLGGMLARRRRATRLR